METRTVNPIVILDTRGRAYTVRASDVPGGRGDGVPVTTLIELSAGGKVAQAIVGAPDQQYLVKLLPVKLGLELVYVRRAGLGYDPRIVVRTLTVIAARLLGKQSFRQPPELALAERDGLIVAPRRADPIPAPRPRHVMRLDLPDIAAAQAQVLL